MQNKMNLTDKELQILNRFGGRNKKASVRNITRMLRFLPTGELEPAMSLIAKLRESRGESRVSGNVTEKAGLLLEKLSISRAYCLLGSTSQLHYFAV